MMESCFHTNTQPPVALKANRIFT